MISQLRTCLINISRLLAIFYYLRFRLVSSARAQFKFLRSQAVGNNLYKISVRFREISKSLELISSESPIVLEFGTGSSTILFYQHPKVSKLISLEQDKKYLPTLTKSKKDWLCPELQLLDYSFKDYQSRVFDKYENYVRDAKLIYVDGPSTFNNAVFNLSEPNLELLFIDNLSDKVILVDCRSLTVIELFLKLFGTHKFIPSKSVCSEYSKSPSIQARFPAFAQAINNAQNLGVQILGFRPIRTSFFIPAGDLKTI